MWLADFKDGYTDLIRKLRWSFSLALVQMDFAYILNVDDDSFVNIPSLLHWLSSQPRQMFYGGALIPNGKVQRLPSSKWAVDNETFPDDFYPPYMYGAGYVVSRDVAAVLADEQSYDEAVQKMWIDDVIVGIVLNRRLPSLKAVDSRLFFGFLSQCPHACRGLQAALIGNVPIMQMVRYHRNLMKGQSLC